MTLDQISEAYTAMLTETKINGIEHVASQEHHDMLKSHGWDTFNPYESPKRSYSLDKENENKIFVSKTDFTHEEPNGMKHSGPISLLSTHLSSYHKK